MSNRAARPSRSPPYTRPRGLEKRAVIVPYCSWQLDPKSGGNIQNIVWAEARGDEASAIGPFPVRYKKAMAESGFAAEYYRELVYAHVDNINLLYVALTRAAESLHLFIPQKSERTVGACCCRVSMWRESAHAGAPRREPLADERGEHYRFGSLRGLWPENGRRPKPAMSYWRATPPPWRSSGCVFPRRAISSREANEARPRNFGILMHRAFEQAADVPEIHAAVAAMQADGTLTAEEATRLGKQIDRALERPEVSEWFGGSWEQVRNEQEIILPHAGPAAPPTVRHDAPTA